MEGLGGRSWGWGHPQPTHPWGVSLSSATSLHTTSGPITVWRGSSAEFGGGAPGKIQGPALPSCCLGPGPPVLLHLLQGRTSLDPQVPPSYGPTRPVCPQPSFAPSSRFISQAPGPASPSTPRSGRVVIPSHLWQACQRPQVPVSLKKLPLQLCLRGGQGMASIVAGRGWWGH